MKIGSAILSCVALASCASSARFEATVVARATAPVVFRMASFVPSQEILFVRCTNGTAQPPAYAKVVYEWMPPAPEAELPPDLLKGLHAWRFRVVRDSTCDQAIGDIPDLKLIDQDGSQASSVIPGVFYSDEDQPHIPPHEVLQCYRLKDKVFVHALDRKAAQQ